MSLRVAWTQLTCEMPTGIWLKRVKKKCPCPRKPRVGKPPRAEGSGRSLRRAFWVSALWSSSSQYIDLMEGAHDHKVNWCYPNASNHLAARDL